jgi:hypothetical protein
LFVGFDGFMEVLADGMIPELFFLNAPLTGDTESFPSFLVPLLSGAALVETLGVAFDDRYGFIGYWALDCEGAPAEGVIMSNDAGGVVYNFVDGVPAFQPMTADGIGGFLNVPPGRVLIRAVVANGGQTVAVRSFVVRGGWISVSNLRPQSE